MPPVAVPRNRPSPSYLPGAGGRARSAPRREPRGPPSGVPAPCCGLFAREFGLACLPLRGGEEVPVDRVMPLAVHLVERLEDHAGAGGFARDPEDLRRGGERRGPVRHGLQTCQQPAALGHDPGDRLPRIDLGTEDERAVQERQSIRIVPEPLGPQPERHGDLQRVTRPSTTGGSRRSRPACSPGSGLAVELDRESRLGPRGMPDPHRQLDGLFAGEVQPGDLAFGIARLLAELQALRLPAQLGGDEQIDEEVLSPSWK